MIRYIKWLVQGRLYCDSNDCKCKIIKSDKVCPECGSGLWDYDFIICEA